jgi:hypothetical protein
MHHLPTVFKKIALVNLQLILVTIKKDIKFKMRKTNINSSNKRLVTLKALSFIIIANASKIIIIVKEPWLYQNYNKEKSFLCQPLQNGGFTR